MGTLQFHLPPELAAAPFEELKQARVTGGQDGMPFLTQVDLSPGRLRLTRRDDESGCVNVPWVVDRAGTLMTSTATLIERAEPYSLVLELARGKVNQLRNQAADWMQGGLGMPSELAGAIREATIQFGRAMSCSPSAESISLATKAITGAYVAAEQLVRAYTQQVFQVRKQRQARLDTTLGCQLGTTIPAEPVAAALRDACNSVCIPFSWANVELAEKDYRWQAPDEQLDWAITNGFHVVGGPLIDFESAKLPGWLTRREMSLAGITSCTCGFAAAVIKRYRGRIRTWQLTAGGNTSSLLGIGEEEMLWLTLRIAEAARQQDPNAELVIDLAQPWGDYLANQVRHHSPFMFADTLARSGLNLAGLNLELVMGVTPAGSYCRDLLDASRIIDLYSLLGLPLQITLGFPSASGRDGKASPEQSIGAGRWRDGCSPEMQASWADAFTALALCKPSVRAVHWVHLSDAEPHLFPACGVVDEQGKAKPALARLAQLRAAHLR